MQFRGTTILAAIAMAAVAGAQTTTDAPAFPDVEVSTTFAGDLSTTSKQDQDTIIAAVNTQLMAAFGTSDVHTTLTAGSIIATSSVGAPTIDANPTGVTVQELGLPGVSSVAPARMSAGSQPFSGAAAGDVSIAGKSAKKTSEPTAAGVTYSPTAAKAGKSGKKAKGTSEPTAAGVTYSPTAAKAGKSGKKAKGTSEPTAAGVTYSPTAAKVGKSGKVKSSTVGVADSKNGKKVGKMTQDHEFGAAGAKFSSTSIIGAACLVAGLGLAAINVRRRRNEAYQSADLGEVTVVAQATEKTGMLAKTGMTQRSPSKRGQSTHHSSAYGAVEAALVK